MSEFSNPNVEPGIEMRSFPLENLYCRRGDPIAIGATVDYVFVYFLVGQYTANGEHKDDSVERLPDRRSKF